MEFLKDNTCIIEDISELPNFSGAMVLYCDIETENNTAEVLPKKQSGLHPYQTAKNGKIYQDKIASLAITVDNIPQIFYIPLRHKMPSGKPIPYTAKYKNLPLEPVLKWLQDILNSVKYWVNHNVTSFDGPFFIMEGLTLPCDLVDTLTLAKLYRSDKLDYGLKDLCADWCGLFELRKHEEELHRKLKSFKTNDYSRIPIDILAEYACWDVRGNRALFEFLLKMLPTEVQGVATTEIKLAKILCNMQIAGLKIDPIEVKWQSYQTIEKLLAAAQELKDLTGIDFVDSNKCISELLLGVCKLPVLVNIKEKDSEGKLVDTDRASFDKEALSLYAVHPKVVTNPVLTRIINALITCRQCSQYEGLYLNAFLTLADINDRIHPKYNSSVRTGRMSSYAPNIQQQNKFSKRLLHPDDGRGFISWDYSQIEFRGIVHYIKDETAIAAYNANPRTDFHQWVADLISIKRDQGKTCNFAIGYGAGEATVKRALMNSKALIEITMQDINEMINAGRLQDGQRLIVFQELLARKAKHIYDTYHDTFPGIKIVSKDAAIACKRRGYVFNLFGRRCHIPETMARKAFNNIVQSFAGDLLKARVVALAPEYNEVSASYGIKLSALVHDEILIQTPLEVLHDESMRNHVRAILEEPVPNFRVPIIVDCETSDKSWGECA